MEPGPRVGFLGAGRMASALARGWIAAGLTTGERVLASDPVAAAREAFTGGGPLRAVLDNREVVAHADLLVLAVKPQSMKALMEEVRPHLADRHLIVSIAAGVTLRQLTDGLGPKRRLVRVMPTIFCKRADPPEPGI